MIEKIIILLVLLFLIILIIIATVNYINFLIESRPKHYQCPRCKQNISLKVDPKDKIKKCDFIITCPECLFQFLSKNSVIKKNKNTKKKKRK